MRLRCLFLGTLSVTCLLSGASLAPAGEGGQAKKRPPNILFIMSDDHATAAIGCYNSWLKEVAPTPNLDRLAQQGIRFTNCVVTNSICTPSRGAILTGQYSHKNGVYTLADPIDPNRQHLAHLLRHAGYQTAVIGKWHLHSDPQGFDHWYILPGQGQYQNPVFWTQDRKGKRKVVHKGAYSEDVIADQSIEWLKGRDRDRPFFLMCHFKAPHRPWNPAPRFQDLFKGKKIPEPETLLDTYADRSKAAKKALMRIGEHMNLPVDLGVKEPPPGLEGLELRRWAYQHFMKRYLSCVAAVDENVGRLLDFLDQEGLTEDTIVIYTSDQGFFLGEHGWYDKRFMYEPSLLMPLIVRYPGHIKGGTVTNALALNIDFAPTLLDLGAGIKTPVGMQGRSLRPLLEGHTPRDWPKSMYYRYYMHLGDHGVPAHYGVRTDRYTLIHYYGQPLGMKGAVKKPTEPEWELFDRVKDPHQVRNVYHDPAYADTVAELKKELQQLQERLGDSQ